MACGVALKGPAKETDPPKTQKAISKLVHNQPGISYTDIVTVISVPESTLRYHLIQLERSGEIRKGRSQGRIRYFPATRAPSSLSGGPMSAQQRQLWNMVADRPGMTVRDLQKKTGIPKANLYYHLRSMVEYGTLFQKRKGRSMAYYHRDPAELEYERELRLLIWDLIRGKLDEATYGSRKEKLKIKHGIGK